MYFLYTKLQLEVMQKNFMECMGIFGTVDICYSDCLCSHLMGTTSDPKRSRVLDQEVHWPPAVESMCSTGFLILNVGIRVVWL